MDGRSAVACSSRYLEELENISSPGVVSKTTAYFEQVIRSVSSSTDKSRHSGTKTAAGSTSHATMVNNNNKVEGNTARSLDFFSSTSEEPGPESDSYPSSGVSSDELQECIGGDDACADSGDPVHVLQLLKENQDPHSEAKDSFQNKDNESWGVQKKKKPEPALPKVAFLRASTTSSSLPLPGRGSSARRRNIQESVVSKSTNFTTPQPFKLSTDKKKGCQGDKTKLNPTAAITSSPSQEAVVKQIPKKADNKTNRSLDKPEPSTSGRASGGGGSTTKYFSLKTDERAEKRRKQFYTKLEEKMVAKEQEKNQIKVKTQDETEAELRKLRQSFNFKAKPMPNFYHDAKLDRKKAPTTRPVSPKLGRRNHANNKHGSGDPVPGTVHSSSQKQFSSGDPENNVAAPSSDAFLKEEDEGILLPSGAGPV